MIDGGNCSGVRFLISDGIITVQSFHYKVSSV